MQWLIDAMVDGCNGCFRQWLIIFPVSQSEMILVEKYQPCRCTCLLRWRWQWRWLLVYRTGTSRTMLLRTAVSISFQLLSPRFLSCRFFCFFCLVILLTCAVTELDVRTISREAENEGTKHPRPADATGTAAICGNTTSNSEVLKTHERRRNRA